MMDAAGRSGERARRRGSYRGRRVEVGAVDQELRGDVRDRLSAAGEGRGDFVTAAGRRRERPVENVRLRRSGTKRQVVGRPDGPVTSRPISAVERSWPGFGWRTTRMATLLPTS